MKKYYFSLFFFFALSLLKAEDRIGFEFSINGTPVTYNISSFSAMPGDTLHLVFAGNSTDQYTGRFEAGQLIEDSRFEWRYIVPQKSGHTNLEILHNNPPEKLKLNIFVLVPASQMKGEYLNGYRIGNYPKKPFRNNPKYLPPEGFIEVTEAIKDEFVSPHFQIKQFLCKQQPGQWPKYLLLDQLLLNKLEMIIEELNKSLTAEQLFIMSGFRTPYYNAAINNGKYSRHIYGDAADIYVDDNRDGVIDDLNKDGKASKKDAEVLYQIIEEIERNPKHKQLIGGLHTYNKTAAHTWDVHTDTRGYKARW